MRFNLKRMCANCPFRADGNAIPLAPGRVRGIVKSLQDDYNTFPCHKTTHGAAKEESACIGAAAYMWKVHGRLSILSRLAIMVGSLSRGTLDKVGQHTISTTDPEHEPQPSARSRRAGGPHPRRDGHRGRSQEDH